MMVDENYIIEYVTLDEDENEVDRDEVEFYDLEEYNYAVKYVQSVWEYLGGEDCGAVDGYADKTIIYMAIPAD